MIFSIDADKNFDRNHYPFIIGTLSITMNIKQLKKIIYLAAPCLSCSSQDL